MQNYKGFLSTIQRREILLRHRCEEYARFSDRLKTVLLLDDGYSFEQISKILFRDDQTIRNYLAKFQEGGICELLSDKYTGYSGCLTEDEEQELAVHLEQHTYLDTAPIIFYVNYSFGKEYTPSGMRDMLNRLGFTYKKTSHVPGNADPEKQQRFINAFAEFMKNKSPDVPVLFMDATHPQHNSMPAYGWIRKGERKEIPSNTGRDKLNINGALNVEDKKAIIVEADTIDADSTICLFKKIEAYYAYAPHIYIFADNARYYHSEKVKEYLKTSRILLENIPPYSPNLNPIERLWKFFHKIVRYNKYYKTFSEFRTEALMFFDRLGEYADNLNTLLTLNFRALNGKKCKIGSIC